MTLHHMAGVVPRKRHVTTTPSAHRIPDLLRGDFDATRPDEAWAGDLAYTRTRQGFLYLPSSTKHGKTGQRCVAGSPFSEGSLGGHESIRVRGGRLFGFEKAVPASSAFDSVAVMAQQLKILKGVRSALGTRNDVIKGHVFEQIEVVASGAAALLFLIKICPRLGRNSYVTGFSVPEDSSTQLRDERRTGYDSSRPTDDSSTSSRPIGHSSTSSRHGLGNPRFAARSSAIHRRSLRSFSRCAFLGLLGCRITNPVADRRRCTTDRLPQRSGRCDYTYTRCCTNYHGNDDRKPDSTSSGGYSHAAPSHQCPSNTTPAAPAAPNVTAFDKRDLPLPTVSDWSPSAPDDES